MSGGYLLPCSEVPGTEPAPAESGPLGRRPCLEDGPGLRGGCSPASPARGPDRIPAAAPSPVPSRSQWRSGSRRRQRGAVVPAAATPGPAGRWCWSPVLCFWPGQGTPVWYLQLGTDGRFLCQCKSSPSRSGGWRSLSPGAPEAQPCSRTEERRGVCRLRLQLLASWDPAPPVSEAEPHARRPEKRALPRTLGASANVGRGATSYFQVFSVSTAWRLHFILHEAAEAD